jgi:hypothetical protein
VLAIEADSSSSRCRAQPAWVSLEWRAAARRHRAREERRRRALGRGGISGEAERRLRADKVVALCGASRNRSGMGSAWKKTADKWASHEEVVRPTGGPPRGSRFPASK